MRHTYSQRNHTHLLGLTLALAGLLAWAALLPGRVGLAIAETAGPSWSYTGSLNTVRRAQQRHGDARAGLATDR